MDRPEIRSVWSQNLLEEMMMLDAALRRYPVVAVDTEFPGCLRRTPREASESVRYRDMIYNVGATELVQLGMTLSDSFGYIYATWEINFCFDLRKEAHAGDSVRFLKNNGIDFDELSKSGVERASFVVLFGDLLRKHRNNLTWVTFHGLYDMAYLLKLVTNKLPDCMELFSLWLGQAFERVIDLKYCARFSKDLLMGELGLEELGQQLKLQRVGGAHNAGSDSLLTARAFHKMNVNNPSIQGFLYGLSSRIYLPKCFYNVQSYSQQPNCIYNVQYYSRQPNCIYNVQYYSRQPNCIYNVQYYSQQQQVIQ